MPTNLNSTDYGQLAAVYDLLSRLWIEEVDLDLLKALTTEEMKAGIENLGGKLPEKVDQEMVDELAVDYCQLLIGPQGHISPIQSVWESRSLDSEAASSMRKFIELLPEFEPCGNMPDHIAVQLQFMGEIFNVAAEDNDSELVDQIADKFFKKHLSWSRPFLDAVAEKANTEFYIGLANLTANFLHLEPNEY